MCEQKTTTTIENFRDDIQIKTYYPEKLYDPISQGDIRYVDFGYYEDKGTKECGKQRPAIVFQIDTVNTTDGTTFLEQMNAYLQQADLDRIVGKNY